MVKAKVYFFLSVREGQRTVHVMQISSSDSTRVLYAHPRICNAAHAIKLSCCNYLSARWKRCPWGYRFTSQPKKNTWLHTPPE